MIKISCAKCGHSIGASEKYAGKTVACPKCKAAIHVTNPSGQTETCPPNIIKFHCPHCNQKIGLPSEYEGKQVRCAKCKNTFVVPQAASALKPTVPAEKPTNDFNPFDDNLLNLDALKQAEQNAPAADMPMRLAPADKPTQQSEFANMVGRSSTSSLESPGVRGSSTPFKIDSTSISLLASIIFVIIGGMFWGLLAKYTGMEFGLAALGIGGLAGLGIYLFTSSRGTFLGVLAALIAFFGILTGKYFIAKWYFMPQFMAELRENGTESFVDPNNIDLTDKDIQEILSDRDQMFRLAAMQLSDEGKITKEDAKEYGYGANALKTLSQSKEDPNNNPTEAQLQQKEQRRKEVETIVYKYLAEWNEEKKIEVVKTQYPKMMKELADAFAKSPIINAVGFVVAYIAAFSFFDLLWFPMAMVTAYKFGTGENS
jgi:hypothetical protein